MRRRTFMPLAGSVSTSSAPNARSRMRRSSDMDAGMVSTSCNTKARQASYEQSDTTID